MAAQLVARHVATFIPQVTLDATVNMHVMASATAWCPWKGLVLPSRRVLQRAVRHAIGQRGPDGATHRRPGLYEQREGPKETAEAGA